MLGLVLPVTVAEAGQEGGGMSQLARSWCWVVWMRRRLRKEEAEEEEEEDDAASEGAISWHVS